MLIVDNCIITDDIADHCFCCDLATCKGQCCVEGDAGAPLESSEVRVLESIWPAVSPYMTEAGRRAVETQGVAVDTDTDQPCTPLVDGRECAYVVWQEGKALCAIEKACRDHKTDFLKPVSCHLYPIRVDNFGEFTSLNYHRWNVCRTAATKGAAQRIPLYKYLKEPLIRRFGKEWYSQLETEINDRFAQ